MDIRTYQHIFNLLFDNVFKVFWLKLIVDVVITVLLQGSGKNAPQPQCPKLCLETVRNMCTFLIYKVKIKQKEQIYKGHQSNRGRPFSTG
jgi:hypothetical protein